nr:response regulator [Porphyrobacter sp. GA68]
MRVLVVEDEGLVALLLEDMLHDLGMLVAGIANRVDQALGLIEKGGIDAAILDVNLSGERSYPVADALRVKGVPYVFATGYGAAALEENYASDRVIPKPYSSSDIAAALADMTT